MLLSDLEFCGEASSWLYSNTCGKYKSPFSQQEPKLVTHKWHIFLFYTSTHNLKFKTTSKLEVNKFLALTLKVEKYYCSQLLQLPCHLLVCMVARNLCLLIHYTPPLMAPTDHGIFPTRFPQLHATSRVEVIFKQLPKSIYLLLSFTQVICFSPIFKPTFPAQLKAGFNGSLYKQSKRPDYDITTTIYIPYSL